MYLGILGETFISSSVSVVWSSIDPVFPIFLGNLCVGMFSWCLMLIKNVSQMSPELFATYIASLRQIGRYPLV